MKKIENKEAAARKPRADALRNRALLLQAAKETFASKGAAASLEEIAKAAGVGIGTLYRHFPTREVMIDAVYQAESEQMMKAASDLASSLAPVEALRVWLLRFVDYMEVKHGMVEILNTTGVGPVKLTSSGRESLPAAFERLANRAKDAGEIHLEGDPINLLRAIVGVLSVSPSPEKNVAARQLVEVIVAGLRHRIAEQ
jgi:AcrR family transcriptional regulator